MPAGKVGITQGYCNSERQNRGIKLLGCGVAIKITSIDYVTLDRKCAYHDGSQLISWSNK